MSRGFGLEDPQFPGSPRLTLASTHSGTLEKKAQLDREKHCRSFLMEYIARLL